MERRTKQLIFTPKESVKRPGTSAKVSPFDLVRNFVRDGKEILADKARMVSEETKSERLDLCKACDHVKGQGSQIRCMHPKCGCFMSIKAGFKKAKCPVGKWQSE